MSSHPDDSTAGLVFFIVLFGVIAATVAVGCVYLLVYGAAH